MVTKVFEFAKKRGIETKVLMADLKALGFNVKPLSVMTEEMQKAVPKPEIHLRSQSPVEDIKKASKQPEPVTTVASENVREGNREVIFFSPSRNHDIAYKKETYFGNTSKIKDQAQSIRFDDYEYRTSDPEEIEFIKNTKSFRVRSTGYPNGKIRIVTEAQLASLKLARAPRVTEVKSTEDKRTADGIDMNQFAPLPDVV